MAAIKVTEQIENTNASRNQNMEREHRAEQTTHTSDRYYISQTRRRLEQTRGTGARPASMRGTVCTSNIYGIVFSHTKKHPVVLSLDAISGRKNKGGEKGDEMERMETEGERRREGFIGVCSCLRRYSII